MCGGKLAAAWKNGTLSYVKLPGDTAPCGFQSEWGKHGRHERNKTKMIFTKIEKSTKRGRVLDDVNGK